MVLRVEALFASRGLKPLLGMTPSLVAQGRVGEIRSWLQKFATEGLYPQWVAIDDSRLDGLRGHLVRTDGERGLTPQDAYLAIGLLKGSTALSACKPGSLCVFCRSAKKPQLLGSGGGGSGSRTASPATAVSRAVGSMGKRVLSSSSLAALALWWTTGDEGEA